jgi:protein phosphatase
MMRDISEDDTQPRPRWTGSSGTESEPGPVPSISLDVAGLTDRGKVRSENQDHFLVARAGRFSRTLASSLPPGAIPETTEVSAYFMIVADGMGGAAGGETASRTAISTLVHMILDTPDWLLRVDEMTAREILKRAAIRYKALDAAIAERAKAEPTLKGMGTTMTVAYSLDLDLFLAHVGDSRAYLLRGGDIRQLTRDHTQVQILVDAGVLTREEAATHRLRNVLTSVLGGGKPLQDVELHRVKAAPGDVLLLCTDGLHAETSDEEIAAVLGGAPSSIEACRSLVDLSMLHGASDNVTVVVARYVAA